MGKSASKPGPETSPEELSAFETAMLCVGPPPNRCGLICHGVWESIAAWVNGLFSGRSKVVDTTDNSALFVPKETPLVPKETPLVPKETPLVPKEASTIHDKVRKLLVICPPFRGTAFSPNVKPLISMALARGWHVVVHLRGKKVLGDIDSLKKCIEYAKKRINPKFFGVIGMSLGSYEVSKAKVVGARGVVSISNAYDLTLAEPHVPLLVHKHIAGIKAKRVSDVYGPLSCAEELTKAESPTLLINSRNDPLVPEPCVVLGEEIARKRDLVSSVTTPYGGHVGFMDKKGKRWAYELALEFISREHFSEE